MQVTGPLLAAAGAIFLGMVILAARPPTTPEPNTTPTELQLAANARPEGLLKGEPWPPGTAAHALYALEHGMYDPDAPGAPPPPEWWPHAPDWMTREERADWLRAQLIDMERECAEISPVVRIPPRPEHEWCP